MLFMEFFKKVVTPAPDATSVLAGLGVTSAPTLTPLCAALRLVAIFFY
jgi:hypothetical protein